MSLSAKLKNSLDQLQKKLQGKGFTQVLPIDAADDAEAGSIVWGMNRGVETSRIFLLCVEPEHRDRIRPEYVYQQMWSYSPQDLSEDAYPKFGLISDGSEQEKVFDLEYPPHEIDQLPSIEEINEYKRIKADPTYRWSMKIYERLMNGFNAFHEQVYQTVKDRVSGKNDIILEVCKILFLEAFRLHHADEDPQFEWHGQQLRLDEVFTVDYVREHGKTAVEQIQVAFDQFKTHPDYVVTDDAGGAHPIFDKNTHLNLTQPRN